MAMAVWFSEWTRSPTHKALYQTAISLGAACTTVAAVESVGISADRRPWVVLVVACLIAVGTSVLLRYWLWRQYAPYVTIEQSRRLHSPQALPAPVNARFWFALAMSFTMICAFMITFDALSGGPIWRIGEMPSTAWIWGTVAPIGLSCVRPFNKLPGPA
jgi:hypothetical protein